MLSAVLAVLSFTTMLKTEEFGVLFEIEEDSFFVNENPIWIGKLDSLFSCSQMCAREPFCKSANYMTAEETCSLHRETRKMYPDRLLKQKGSSYIEKVRYKPGRIKGHLNTFALAGSGGSSRRGNSNYKMYLLS